VRLNQVVDLLQLSLRQQHQLYTVNKTPLTHSSVVASHSLRKTVSEHSMQMTPKRRYVALMMVDTVCGVLCNCEIASSQSLEKLTFVYLLVPSFIYSYKQLFR